MLIERNLEKKQIQDALDKVTFDQQAEMNRIQAMGNPKRSLYCFDDDGTIRTFTRYVTSRPWFEPFIMVTILANCIFMAIDDNPDPGTDKYLMLKSADVVFTVIFVIEMVLKVITLGFYYAGESSYLRNGWNQLDFVVVGLGLMSYVGLQNFTVIRTFRLLRPLRAIKNIPELKIIITALLASLGYLWDVMALLTFMMMVFGILGVQLYGGYLSNRCFITGTGQLVPWDLWPHGCSTSYVHALL